eukprot:gene17372-20726_t
MACPNLTAAINSYHAQLPNPIINSMLEISMAGGLYNASNGNSDLDLMFLNVTIRRSPFTPGEVIINYYSPWIVSVSLFKLKNETSKNPAVGPTNVVLNSLTLTNGSQAFSSVAGNVIIILENVIITDFSYYLPVISSVALVDVSFSLLFISHSEFINNTASEIISTTRTDHIQQHCSITNSILINNTGGGIYGNLVSITDGNWIILNNLFDGNTNYSNIIMASSADQVSITDTTFTNNDISSSDDGMIVCALTVTRLTMDNCTFSNNSAPMEIFSNQSDVWLSNILFGQVHGLIGIQCITGSITMNNISSHLGEDIYDCDPSTRCSTQGNYQECPNKKLRGGAIAGIVIGSVAGVIVVIVIAGLVATRMKKKSQYLAIQ